MKPVSRGLIALACVTGWMSATVGARGATAIPHPHGLAALVDLSFLASPVALGLLTVVYLAAVGLHVARIKPAVAGIAAFVAMYLVVMVDNGQYPTPGQHHDKHLPILIVLATSLALALKKGERVAYEAVCGVVAANYTLAGGIKLWHSGLDWAFSGVPRLVAERSVEPGLFSTIRAFAVGFPTLLELAALFVLMVELVGVLFLWERFRRPFALTMATCHISIGFFLGYFYPSWVLCLLALAISGPPEATPDPAR